MENRDRIREYAVLFAYVLWMISSIFGITLWTEFELVKEFRTYATQIAYLILVISFFFKNKYNRKDVAGIAMIIYCCIVSGQSVHNKSIVPVSIFVYFMSEVEYKKILKCTFVLQAVIMVITVLASQIGIIEDIIWTEGERIRHSLGYDYCGYPGHIMLFMTLTWFCFRQKRRILEGVAWIGLNYYIYVVTDARTDYYLSILGVVGFFTLCGNWKRKLLLTIRDTLILYGFWIAAIVSIAVHWIYNAENSFLVKMNHLLNGRLLLGYNAIKEYGFSLFGQKIRWFGQGSLRADPTRIYNYVDCSFLKETLSYGIVFLIVLGIGFYITCKNIIMIRNYTLGWAVLVSMAYAVINAHLCVLTFNVFILVIGNCFSEKNIHSKQASSRNKEHKDIYVK